MIINNKVVLSLLVILALDVPVIKTMDIADIADQGIYIASVQDILLMIQATDEFVRKHHTPVPFHDSAFHWQARSRSYKRHRRYIHQGEVSITILALF